ncbi:SDR family oxidoreductase [Amycolatopsis sacchari]|uniref:SDR family oxidoreductase n=1 Tax=Amycolatopsis sacchari TaxID=115433 RepID=UPI003EB729EE
MTGIEGKVVAITDVTRREDLAGLVEVARERFGRLDVFVNNAGVGLISLIDELRVDDWDEMIDVNLKGVLYGIAAALPVFRAQGSGQFVTIASTAAYRTKPVQTVYSATKVAVRTVCDGLQQEAGDSLRVTTISPGMISTEFAERMDPEVRAQISANMADIGITPDAVARAVAFAVEQPDDVDVSEIVVRPTAQS